MDLAVMVTLVIHLVEVTSYVYLTKSAFGEYAESYAIVTKLVAMGKFVKTEFVNKAAEMITLAVNRKHVSTANVKIHARKAVYAAFVQSAMF